MCSSSGSKNATGSAVWMSTGNPSSPAVRRAVTTRRSFGRTSAPVASRRVSPRSFHTFTPRAPRRAESAISAASASWHSGESSSPASSRSQSLWQNVRTRPGSAASKCARLASSSSPHSPSRLTTASRWSRSSVASSSSASPPRKVPSADSQRPRWLWTSIPRQTGASTCVTGRTTAGVGHGRVVGASSPPATGRMSALMRTSCDRDCASDRCARTELRVWCADRLAGF